MGWKRDHLDSALEVTPIPVDLESAAQSNSNLSFRAPCLDRGVSSQLILLLGELETHPLTPSRTQAGPLRWLMVALDPPLRNSHQKTFHCILFILSASSLPPPSPASP